MKIQLKDILALGFLVMLFVGIVEGIKCLGCTDVQPNNRCRNKAYVCDAGNRRFCYIQKLYKLHKVTKIQRGCASQCRSETRIKYAYQLITFCCQTKRCNSRNVWY